MSTRRNTTPPACRRRWKPATVATPPRSSPSWAAPSGHRARHAGAVRRRRLQQPCTPAPSPSPAAAPCATATATTSPPPRWACTRAQRFRKRRARGQVHGTLGWRHAYGDVNPASTLSFVQGGGSFTANGVPVARRPGRAGREHGREQAHHRRRDLRRPVRQRQSPAHRHAGRAVPLLMRARGRPIAVFACAIGNAGCA